jgi:hypothetical protein
MSYVAILLASTEPGLEAIAENAGNLQIIPGTVQSYQGLTTYSEPTVTPAGVIATNAPGWIAMARFV